MCVASLSDVIEGAERRRPVRPPRPQDHARAPQDGLDEEGEEQGVRQGEGRAESF